jgi:hypothetical protein
LGVALYSCSFCNESSFHLCQKKKKKKKNQLELTVNSWINIADGKSPTASELYLTWSFSFLAQSFLFLHTSFFSIRRYVFRGKWTKGFKQFDWSRVEVSPLAFTLEANGQRSLKCLQGNVFCEFSYQEFKGKKPRVLVRESLSKTIMET